MLKLSTDPLGRLLRVDEPVEELGISSYDRLRDAVRAGDKEIALKLIDYVQIEGKGLHDFYCDWSYALLTWIADSYGEEKLLEVFRYSKEKTSHGFYDFGKTKKEYPWSWFMKDVPYYCLHCSIWHEMMPIEEKGAPTKVTEYNPDLDAPCKFYFYKKPELFPEKYCERVGLRKPPQKRAGAKNK